VRASRQASKYQPVVKVKNAKGARPHRALSRLAIADEVIE
jgi:hypothetical protein